MVEKQSATFAIKVSGVIKERLDGALRELAERQDMTRGQFAESELLPWLEGQLAEQQAPSLAGYVAAIRQAQSVIDSNVRTIVAAYALVEEAERAKAQSGADALNQALVGEQKKSCELQEKCEALRRTVTEREEEIARLKEQLEAAQRDRGDIAEILQAISSIKESEAR